MLGLVVIVADGLLPHLVLAVLDRLTPALLCGQYLIAQAFYPGIDNTLNHQYEVGQHYFRRYLRQLG